MWKWKKMFSVFSRTDGNLKVGRHLMNLSYENAFQGKIVFVWHTWAGGWQEVIASDNFLWSQWRENNFQDKSSVANNMCQLEVIVCIKRLILPHDISRNTYETQNMRINFLFNSSGIALGLTIWIKSQTRVKRERGKPNTMWLKNLKGT